MARCYFLKLLNVFLVFIVCISRVGCPLDVQEQTLNPNRMFCCLRSLFSDSGISSAEMVSKMYNSKVLSILNMQTLLTFLEDLIEEEKDEGKRQELIKNREDLKTYRQRYGSI